MPSREGFPLEQGSSLPPPSQPETGHHGALFKVALCLQYNVAEGSGADTTGNLPVSEEAASAAEVAGCRWWSVLQLLSRLPFPAARPPQRLLIPSLSGFPQLSRHAKAEQVEGWPLGRLLAWCAACQAGHR